MVKYLSRGGSLTLLVLACTAALALSYSKAPVPTCNSLKIGYQDWPISLHESQNINLDNFFSGYNINLTIPSKPDFVHLRPKVQNTASNPKKQPGLRNYHLAHNGNRHSEVLVTLNVDGARTYVNWGVSDETHLIPDLSNTATVENDTHVQCFDAVWIRDQNLIMVDCVQNASSITLNLVNYFYYINASTKQTIGKKKNDVYVPFTEMRYRKIALLTEDGYHYLIRAYFAQYVD